MSEPTEETDGYVEPTGQFHPAVHDGIPVGLAAEYGGKTKYGRLGRDPHPPLYCPDPRYPATLRGFYRCPACGAKVPLAGHRTGSDIGYELGEKFAESVAKGIGQAFWLTVDITQDIAWLVRWVCWWVGKQVGERRAKAPAATGPDPELVRALVLAGMLAQRNKQKDEAVEA
jgi:hypothetical protein